MAAGMAPPGPNSRHNPWRTHDGEVAGRPVEPQLRRPPRRQDSPTDNCAEKWGPRTSPTRAYEYPCPRNRAMAPKSLASGMPRTAASISGVLWAAVTTNGGLGTLTRLAASQERSPWAFQVDTWDSPIYGPAPPAHRAHTTPDGADGGGGGFWRGGNQGAAAASGNTGVPACRPCRCAEGRPGRGPRCRKTCREREVLAHLDIPAARHRTDMPRLRCRADGDLDAAVEGAHNKAEARAKGVAGKCVSSAPSIVKGVAVARSSSAAIAARSSGGRGPTGLGA